MNKREAHADTRAGIGVQEGKIVLRTSLMATALGTALLSTIALGEEAPEEYIPADTEREVLANQNGLASGESLSAEVVQFRFGPGFRTARHYHTGDVFVYVKSGQLKIQTDDGESIVSAGEVYYETPDLPMVGLNASDSEDAEIIVFQVGHTNQPMMIEAE